MSKSLEICNCLECPNCLYEDDHDYFYCDFNLGLVKDPYNEIPNWCPLPECNGNEEGMTLKWKRSDKELPEIGVDVLGCNVDSRDVEMGFRSQIDKDPLDWVDFSFPVTHWAYFNLPE